VQPCIFLIDAMDGSPTNILHFDPEKMGDNASKQILSQEVNRLIQKHGFTTVVTLFDTYEMKFHPGKLREGMALKLELGLSLKELAVAGFGTCKECAKLTVQTMVSCHELTLTYQRNPEDATVTGFDEITERDLSKNESFIGRFRFFQEPGR